MAKKRPVKICTTKQTPSKEPKFHQEAKYKGVGKSPNTRAWFTVNL